MNQLLPRRQFLKTTTGLLTGVVVAGSPLALIAPARTWAIDLTAFTSMEATTLMSLSRTIAPHDKLEDAAYALVIRSVDEDATKDERFRKMVKDGVAALGGDFAKQTENDRVAALKKIEDGEFFRTVRLKIVQVLYATPLAYAYFGYEGEAFSKGGYLLRGFNDLRWLPDVPIEDSGPMPV
ncbi:MAG TPA: hypothetical protein VL983_11275 [Terriglobales bacterium]|nr:hypothetical protein [Terriglobales bacterium]